MSWSQGTLLKFMKVHSDLFGKKVEEVEDASITWVCDKFSRALFRKMKNIDFYQIICSGYADVEYEGKGDIKAIRPNNKFVLSAEQCVDVANFIAGRTSTLDRIDVFAIIHYLKYNIRLYTNYISILSRVLEEKGGE